MLSFSLSPPTHRAPNAKRGPPQDGQVVGSAKDKTAKMTGMGGGAFRIVEVEHVDSGVHASDGPERDADGDEHELKGYLGQKTSGDSADAQDDATGTEGNTLICSGSNGVEGVATCPARGRGLAGHVQFPFLLE